MAGARTVRGRVPDRGGRNPHGEGGPARRYGDERMALYTLKFRDSLTEMDSRFRGNDGQPESNVSR